MAGSNRIGYGGVGPGIVPLAPQPGERRLAVVGDRPTSGTSASWSNARGTLKGRDTYRPGVSRDPTVVRSIAVHRADLVTALEANVQRDAGAVLRVTPPFAGRMRARLHRAGTVGEYDDPEPLHFDPADLVATVPPYPDPDETADRLRESDVAYTRERHRERHTERIAAWRAAAGERVRERVTVRTPAGPHEVEVVTLG